MGKLRKFVSGKYTSLSLLVAVVVASGVLLFVFRPFQVAGNSMQPTFAHGEFVLVETFTHRFDKLTTGRFGLNRGDVLVFENPHDTEHVTIKRVIGLPNEEVDVSREGVRITDRETGEEEFFANGTLIGGMVSGEEFEMKLGPEDYFVLGDNRAESNDSRQFGAVQKVNMIGTVIGRIWPLSQSADDII